MAEFIGKDWFRDNIKPYLGLLKEALGSKISKPASGSVVNSVPKFTDTDGTIENTDVTIGSNGSYLKTPGYMESRISRCKFTDDTHYGYVEFRNNSNERGGYVGYGNGSTHLNFRLDNASELVFSGGSYIYNGETIYNDDVICNSDGVFHGAMQLDGYALGLNRKNLYLGSVDDAGNLVYSSPLGGNGGIGTRISNGVYYAGSAYRYGVYVHIRLPLSIAVVNQMYQFRVRGFTYIDSKLIDITFGGYCYKNGHNLLYANDNNRSLCVPSDDFTNIGQYVGFDEHVYSAFKLEGNCAYMTLNYESMRVGNGGLMGEFTTIVSNFPELTAGTQDEISSGDRRSLITATVSTSTLFQTSNDDPTDLVNGGYGGEVKFEGSNDSTNQWVAFAFDSSKTIKAFVLCGSSVVDNGTVVLEVSDDGSSWTSVGTVTLETATYTLVPSPLAGNHFRFRFEGNTANGGCWLHEMEFEVVTMTT
jgi:hypothetical protein